MFSPNTPIGGLPVLPRLHNGRADLLRLVQPANATHRWVLKFWPTNIRISGNSAPIYEGAIEIQDRRHLADMILLATDSGQYDLPPTRLEAVLIVRFDVKLMNRKNDEIFLENEGRSVDWHGRVLLITRNKAAPERVPIE